MNTACPCGTALPYADCCGRFHSGAQHLLAPSAEALMRSRYSAYTLQLDDYLLATWHPSTRPTAPFHHEDGLRWLGLQVLRLAPQAHAVRCLHRIRLACRFCRPC